MAATSEAKLNLYATDTCPYAQRTWIALLEKEEKPSSPVLFNLKFVNTYDKSLETNREFISVNAMGSVPAAEHKGAKLYGSLLLNEYVDEAIAPHRPLMPPTAEGRWKVRMFIEKNTPLVDSVFPLITANTAEAKAAAVAKALELTRTFISWLNGPYAVGDKFTLADIAFVSIFERLITCGGHYAGFVIPSTPEYAKFHAWWALVNERESVRITRADRTAASLALYPGEEKTRAEYLIGVIEPAHYGVFMAPAFRNAMITAAPGKRLFTVEQLQKIKAEEDAKKK